MTIIFSDGQVGSTMETLGDFSAWTATPTNIATIAVSTDTAHHGVNCSKLDGITFDGRYAFAQKDISATATVFVRHFTKFTADLTNSTSVDLIQCITAYYSFGLWIARDASGNYFWRIARYIEGFTYWDSSTFSLDLNTWYCIQLKVAVNGVAGELRAYVDGVEVVTAAGVDTGANNIITVKAGAQARGTTTAQTIYEDCFVIADAKIDCEEIPYSGTVLTCLWKP